MGRKIPLVNYDPSQAFHRTLSVPVLFAGMAAVMAILTSLCGVRSKRKPDYPRSTPKPEKKCTNSLSSSPLPRAIETHDVFAQTQGSAQVIELIEPESDTESQRKFHTRTKTTVRDSLTSTNLLKKSASTCNLARNLSTRMHRSMSMAGRDLQDRMNKGGKLNPEDSVWMKTIILGEKCRVGDGEEAIIYERKGNKISAYHPKKSNSLINHNPIRYQDERNRQSTDLSE